MTRARFARRISFTRSLSGGETCGDAYELGLRSSRLRRRRRGAFANDEIGRELDPRLDRLLPAGEGQDQLGGRDRHVEQRLADGRQRRPDPAGDRQVVEADDAQVLGDVEPDLACRLVDAERLEVVAGEDRGRAVGRRSRARPFSTPSSTWNLPWLRDPDRSARRPRPSPRGSRRSGPGCTGSNPARR